MATTQEAGARGRLSFRLVQTIAAEEKPVRRARAAMLVCSRPANLRRTVAIALVVGTILTVINQIDVIVHGDATWLTGVKIALNFCVPFLVSNLGVLAGTRSERG
jgi:hypothetical protein